MDLLVLKNKITKNRYGSKCLLGPAYQILNKKYEKRNFSRKKKYTILGTFGGFDEKNIVEFFCHEIENYLDKITVKIILGAATKKSKKTQLLEAKYRKHLKTISSTRDLKKEISSAEFGFCAGGITTYEFAAMGVPFAIICQYKHQLKTAREWQKRKIALNLGLPSKKTKKKIQNIVKNITEGKIPIKIKGKQVVDGFGARRVAMEILKI